MRRLRVLFVAYHFPPVQGSTGASRTLAFAKFLLDYGWDPAVLTIQSSAYEYTAAENEALVPDDLLVERAWGVDARKSLAIRGRYPAFLSQPDRWQSWVLGGFIAGSRMIRRWQPDVIISTYPIPSAHVLGYLLQKRFKLPWVAEFRDPMLQPNYPNGKTTRRVFTAIERRVFNSAKKIIVTTEGCRRFYSERYQHYDKKNIHTISNGYDPDLFESCPTVLLAKADGPKTLLHSGLLYPNERNPSAFFAALHRLKNDGFLGRFDLKFQFRASGNEDYYSQVIRELDLEQHVVFLPKIPYAEAISEMRKADALMLFQADNCNNQIPAKAYEYMYSGRPIVGFADPAGETARLLQSVGICSVAKLEETGQIVRLLRSFIEQLYAGTANVVSTSDALRFSRKTLTERLSEVLHDAVRTA